MVLLCWRNSTSTVNWTALSLYIRAADCPAHADAHALYSLPYMSRYVLSQRQSNYVNGYINLNKMTISKNDMARKVELLEQKVRELQMLTDEQKAQNLVHQHEMEIIMKTETSKDKEIRQIKEDLRKNKFEYNCLLEMENAQRNRNSRKIFNAEMRSFSKAAD
ncbi:UNVERIFIED_CONTAM: hypothetical protein NCL1_27696 [Trichonephila clavipes]